MPRCLQAKVFCATPILHKFARARVSPQLATLSDSKEIRRPIGVPPRSAHAHKLSLRSSFPSSSHFGKADRASGCQDSLAPSNGVMGTGKTPPSSERLAPSPAVTDLSSLGNTCVHLEVWPRSPRRSALASDGDVAAPSPFSCPAAIAVNIPASASCCSSAECSRCRSILSISSWSIKGGWDFEHRSWHSSST